MASTPTEYTFKFDIGETVRFVYEHPAVTAIVTAIVIWGNYTIHYRCAYMLNGKRYEDVFAEAEIRAIGARWKGRKRDVPRATAKKSGDTSEKG